MKENIKKISTVLPQYIFWYFIIKNNKNQENLFIDLNNISEWCIFKIKSDNSLQTEGVLKVIKRKRLPELKQIFGDKIIWESLKKAKAMVIYNRIKKELYEKNELTNKVTILENSNLQKEILISVSQDKETTPSVSQDKETNVSIKQTFKDKKLLRWQKIQQYLEKKFNIHDNCKIEFTSSMITHAIIEYYLENKLLIRENSIYSDVQHFMFKYDDKYKDFLEKKIVNKLTNNNKNLDKLPYTVKNS